MKKNPKIELEESSGNVFADLGLDHHGALLIHAQLGHSVRMILEKLNLKQHEIGKLLGTKQPEGSNLIMDVTRSFPRNGCLAFSTSWATKSRSKPLPAAGEKNLKRSFLPETRLLIFRSGFKEFD